MHDTYRAIEYRVVSNIVDYMIDVPYCLQFSICSKEKKNWAALPLVNTYFSLFPNSQVKNKKIKWEKCVGKLHLIVTWSFTQSHNKTLTKKNSPVNLNFTGTLLHKFCLVISTLKALFSGSIGCILLSTSSSSGSLWTVKVTNFNWGSNSCTTWIGSS